MPTNAENGSAASGKPMESEFSHPEAIDEAGEVNKDALATVATVGVVAVGVALFEAALLPGLVIGVAAMLAPKYLPKFGSALSPVFKSTVRSAYKVGQKTKEAVAEAQEQMSDILAEVEAEKGVKAAAPKSKTEAPVA